MTNYTSEFTGQHNDNYDERITTLENLILNLRVTILENTVELQASIINSLTNKLTNYLVVDGPYWSSNFTAAANSTGSCQISIGTKSGYSPLGIVGFQGSGNGNVATLEVYLSSSTTVLCWFRNFTSTAANPKFGVKILWIKN